MKIAGVLCGYVQNPADAYLFGRINDGNAVSFPLGLHFGWAGEINLQSTMDSLFCELFGIGYPPEDALRKQEDTRRLKEINNTTKRSMQEIYPLLDKDLKDSLFRRKQVYQYLMDYGQGIEWLKKV